MILKGVGSKGWRACSAVSQIGRVVNSMLRKPIDLKGPLPAPVSSAMGSTRVRWKERSPRPPLLVAVKLAPENSAPPWLNVR